MKKHFAFVALAAAMLLANGVSAQIAHGGAPMFNRSKGAVPVVKTDAIDNAKLLQEDIDMVDGSSPLRMGVVQQVALSNLNDGCKRTLADGTQVWQLAISSPDALFMNVGFSTFDIPEGAELYLYDESGDFVLGRFTNENRNENGGFYTQALPGEVVYLEYREPAEVAGQGVLVISDVSHGYKNMFGDVLGLKGALGEAEGDCHINVKCSAADDWRDQVRSVVCLQIYSGQYVYSCSGAMINNTRLDRTPYILTAFHCQELDDPISRWIAYFNYQTTMCNNNNGPSNQSVTGATIKAKHSYSGGSDFCLLQLNSAVPDAYKPYYAGWERSNLVNEPAGCGIHHPGGDFKKISIPRQVTRGTSSYMKFLVVDWYTGTNNQGVTEQGSSGSPLFNANKRIVGQLYAGSSACDNMAGQDYYGRIYNSWAGTGSSTGRLSDWLDPDGTNVSYLDGLDYTDPVGISNAEMCAPMSVYPNPCKGVVNIDVDAIGEANYKVFDMSGRCVFEGRTVLTAMAQSLNLSQLPAGSYRVQLFAGSRTFSATVQIVK